MCIEFTPGPSEKELDRELEISYNNNMKKQMGEL